MKFLEKDLEQIIYTSGMDVLEKRGLSISGKLLRQVKIGNYGIADLIEFKRPCYDGPGKKYFIPGRIIIYELKKEQIGISAFFQSLYYAKGIREYLKFKNKHRQYIIDVVLIGKSLDTKGSFCFVENMLSIQNDYYDNYLGIENGTIQFYTYDYDIDGLYFKEQFDFNIKNKGF